MGKSFGGSPFRGRSDLNTEGEPERWTWDPIGPLGAARGRAWPPSGGPVTPPPALLGALGIFRGNIILVNFLEFLGKVDFCTKIDIKGNSAENCVSPC